MIKTNVIIKNVMYLNVMRHIGYKINIILNKTTKHAVYKIKLIQNKHSDIDKYNTR